ncbi:UpxY family transcription antiterminator [Aquimarina gracilis]|uniref:UpxY family transcription antiterminator n=1 Tax=Aquimarina gracilis TaxID=874422 RepID=A0ABU5ZUG1_9FLAO|nr:UpxY family transcription antiterminator [Aquimarina gracilis]MEB3345634.1 UpxY family transcription antiterminator [Aquimarina gracilis]
MTKSLVSGWYVLYVQSRQEKKAQRLLKEKGFDTFLPLVKKIRNWSDRKATIETPLFPSYLFVYISSDKNFYQALSLNEVCAFIKFGNQYARVTEEEVKDIKSIISTPNIDDVYIDNQTVTYGTKMSIKTGPLKGMNCEVIDCNNNNNKIRVRIESLRQDVIVQLKEKDLKIN